MLQKYTFVRTQEVHKLQGEISTFFQKIKGVNKSDVFDPDIYCSVKFSKIVKRRYDKDFTKLYYLISAFFDKYKTLGVRKQKVDRLFIEMNNIPGLCDKKIKRITINDLPSEIRKEAHDLFYHLFEDTLSSFKIKDHYEAFYNELKNAWCPFCGMETLLHFTDQKEDYDHFLPKSVYPFAAVNMRNLSPMGYKCNRVFKKAKDLIWNDVKQIKAVNPYVKKVNIKVDFNGTTLPTATNRKGKWEIKFLPDTDEVKRWNDVYKISKRVTDDFLSHGQDSDYHSWLNFYVNCHSERTDLTTKAKVRASLVEFGNNYRDQRYKDSQYIKADLFKWLGSNGPDNLIESFMNIINRKKVKK